MYLDVACELVGLNIIVGGSASAVSPGMVWNPAHPGEIDRVMATAQACFQRGDVVRARDMYMIMTRSWPFDWRPYWAVGICEMRMGRWGEAEGPLRRAVELEPRSAVAQSWLGEWYLRNGMVRQAEQATGIAIQLDPTDASIMETRAWVLEAGGEMDGAWKIAQSLVEAGKCTPSLARLYGRLAPRFKAEGAALELIGRLLRRPISADDSNLYFTAAALLEREGRYEEAFAAAKRGNEMRPHQKYEPAEMEREVERLTAFFSAERLEKLSQGGARSDRPVFIVGMPRSGTSLVEQILASHPMVYGAGEIEQAYEMMLSAMRVAPADQGNYPECLEALSQQQIDGLGAEYLWKLVGMSPAHVARVTDKMPLNFLHLGLIQMALPGARVIYCKRDAMDNCVSCHMTDFNMGNEFKYKQSDLGHFYRLHERLMAHWKKTLRIPILEVGYEELVRNAERVSRQMVEFVGLPWEERCGRFHETKRSVATASVQQVRRPMYESSIGRWEKYEKWLGELKGALGIRE